MLKAVSNTHWTLAMALKISCNHMERHFGLLEKHVKWELSDLVMYWAYQEKACLLCAIWAGFTITKVRLTVYKI